MRRWAERGTVSVITAFLLVSMLGTLALVVDIGFSYGQRRLAQNVADSAAVAATKVVARRIVEAGQGSTVTQSDAAVLAAVSDVAQRSSGAFTSPLPSVTYVDTSLNSLGTASSGDIPAAAKGVQITSGKSFSALFGAVLGTTTLSIGARATARTDAITGLHPGFYGPYVIWGGEEREHKCTDPLTGQVLTHPDGSWRGGCNLLNKSITYRCNQYDKCNVSSRNLRWDYQSSDFKGYLHKSSGYLSVDSEAAVDVQTGNATGTASEPLDELERCYRMPGCTIALPIIDRATNVGSSGIGLRIVGFAAVRLTNNPRTASSSTPWTGVVVPGSIVCCAAGVVTTGPAPSPGVPSLQYVRLVR